MRDEKIAIILETITSKIIDFSDSLVLWNHWLVLLRRHPGIRGCLKNMYTNFYGVQLKSSWVCWKNLFRPLIREALRDEEFYFQQYGAPPHNHRDEIFPNTWISTWDSVEYLPCSSDLTPLNFFLWGYFKDKVYATMLATITEIKLSMNLTMGKGAKCLSKCWLLFVSQLRCQ